MIHLCCGTHSCTYPQDQGPAPANVPHANVHILGWPQPAQIINNERLSVRNGAPSTEITHVAVPSGPAVIAQQTPPAQFHAVNVVQSRGNHSMLQRAPGSSAQPQGGFWDTVMVSGSQVSFGVVNILCIYKLRMPVTVLLEEASIRSLLTAKNALPCN